MDKYLKLLRNYQGYFLVALLYTSDVSKKYQQGTSGAVARDINLVATLRSANKYFWRHS